MLCYCKKKEKIKKIKHKQNKIINFNMYIHDTPNSFPLKMKRNFIITFFCLLPYKTPTTKRNI